VAGPEPRRSRREIARILQRIRALTLELKGLEQRGASQAELDAKGRALERLRWRLAVAARREAHDDLGTAA
jgi:hypothetical protein